MKRAWLKTLWKKSLKLLPTALVGSLLLLLFMGLMATLILNNQDSSVEPKQVYVHIEDEDQMLRSMLMAINQMESIGRHIEFVFVDADLQDSEEKPVGEIYIPTDFYEHIIDGTNEPAKIIIYGGDSLQSRIFYGLAKSGAQMLGRTQAALYAGYAYARETDHQALVGRIEEELNAKYISYVLGRSTYFHREEVSTFSLIDKKSHMISALFMWYILMVTIFYQYLFSKETRDLELILEVKGISERRTSLYKWLILGAHMTLLTLPLLILLKMIYPPWQLGVAQVLTLLFVIGGIGLFHSLLYRVSGEASVGAIWIFFISVVGLLLSGALLPLSFLPAKLQQVASFLPWRGWYLMLGENLLYGNMSWNRNILVFIVIFILLHEMMNQVERRKLS